MKSTPVHVGLALTVLAIVVALSYPFVAPPCVIQTHCPTVGEYANWLAGVAQPLALAWLIAGFWLQRKELALQREELKLTREELQRQAEAQEGTHVAILAQQLLTRVSVARQTIFDALWSHCQDREKGAYETKDLSYVVGRLRLFDGASAMYGTPADKLKAMQGSGVWAALDFAIAEIDFLRLTADKADATGALRLLIERQLHHAELSARWDSARREGGVLNVSGAGDA